MIIDVYNNDRPAVDREFYLRRFAHAAAPVIFDRLVHALGAGNVKFELGESW